MIYHSSFKEKLKTLFLLNISEQCFVKVISKTVIMIIYNAWSVKVTKDSNCAWTMEITLLRKGGLHREWECATFDYHICQGDTDNVNWVFTTNSSCVLAFSHPLM